MGEVLGLLAQAHERLNEQFRAMSRYNGRGHVQTPQCKLISFCLQWPIMAMLISKTWNLQDRFFIQKTNEADMQGCHFAWSGTEQKTCTLFQTCRLTFNHTFWWFMFTRASAGAIHKNHFNANAQPKSKLKHCGNMMFPPIHPLVFAWDVPLHKRRWTDQTMAT